MRVGQIRTNIEQLSDEVEIFIAWYDQDEANEHIQNNLLEGTEWDDTKNLTKDEWQFVIKKMSDDDGIWQQLNESFAYYVEQVIENREKGKENVNSK
jgi:hypothetical protein